MESEKTPNANQESQEGLRKKNQKRTAQKIKPVRAAVPVSEELGSFLENIKLEWNLFWAGIAGEDEPEVQDPFESGRLRNLSLEQVKQITRALSQDRRRINQRMEQINREIETNTERLESLKLVGGDQAPVIDDINKLNDLGLKLSLQLEKVSLQLDRFRSREDDLKGLR